VYLLGIFLTIMVVLPSNYTPLMSITYAPDSSVLMALRFLTAGDLDI
jgi:hypothetical protein